MTQHLSAAEFKDVAKLFKNDICRQCGICKNLKMPEFCAHYFVQNGQNFLTYFIILLHYVKIEKPKLYQALMSPEGFSALICDPDMCTNYSEHRCKNPEMIADCYQLFQYQNGADLDEVVSREIAEDWDEDMYEELCRELDVTAHEMYKLSKKRKKRLFKIGRSALSKLKSLQNRKQACGYTSIKTLPKPKKSLISTKWFGREGFDDVIKNILEGTYKP